MNLKIASRRGRSCPAYPLETVRDFCTFFRNTNIICISPSKKNDRGGRYPKVHSKLRTAAPQKNKNLRIMQFLFCGSDLIFIEPSEKEQSGNYCQHFCYREYRPERPSQAAVNFGCCRKYPSEREHEQKLSANRYDK